MNYEENNKYISWRKILLIVFYSHKTVYYNEKKRYYQFTISIEIL